MAARKQLWHPDAVREKIQATQLVNRLTEHVNSPSPGTMETSQVNAAKALLNKVLPDLSSTALTSADGGPLQINIVRFSEGK